MDSKLKCVFDYVEESEGNVESTAGGNVSSIMCCFLLWVLKGLGKLGGGRVVTVKTHV